MSVQMIELEEIMMIDTSDATLEATIEGKPLLTTPTNWFGWTGTCN